jgi:hypothetical protein
MAPILSRVKQEQLRKRRNNLLRRHNDFWRLYSIRSWLIMEMPNGRIYTYHSHPDVPAPEREDMVRNSLKKLRRLTLIFPGQAPTSYCP